MGRLGVEAIQAKHSPTTADTWVQYPAVAAVHPAWLGAPTNTIGHVSKLGWEAGEDQVIVSFFLHCRMYIKIIIVLNTSLVLISL